MKHTIQLLQHVLLFDLEFKLSFQVSDITLIFVAVRAEMTGMK